MGLLSVRGRYGSRSVGDVGLSNGVDSENELVKKIAYFAERRSKIYTINQSYNRLHRTHGCGHAR